MLPACSSFQNLCESLIDLILNTHPTSATAAIASGGVRNGQQSFINSLIFHSSFLILSRNLATLQSRDLNDAY